jgi:hypothetical protein
LHYVIEFYKYYYSIENETKRLNYFEEFIYNECIRKDLNELNMLNNSRKNKKLNEKINKNKKYNNDNENVNDNVNEN